MALLYTEFKVLFPYDVKNVCGGIDEISLFRDDKFSQKPFSLQSWTLNKTQTNFPPPHRVRRNYECSDLPILFLGVRRHGIVRSLRADQINKTSRSIYFLQQKSSKKTSFPPISVTPTLTQIPFHNRKPPRY